MADPPVDPLGIGATAIDHVGVAVADLEAAIERYRMVFGAEPAHREAIESDGVDEALFAVGGSFVQLLAPTGPDTPVGRFLERRGEGIHHVGYRVPDVAAALEHLRAHGMELADQHPRRGSRGTTVAFAHPRTFGGVLVELVQEEEEGSRA
jgi:methylmalonyl-CoA/ethylmalonyl-CoA epimerase